MKTERRRFRPLSLMPFVIAGIITLSEVAAMAASNQYPDDLKAILQGLPEGKVLLGAGSLERLHLSGPKAAMETVSAEGGPGAKALRINVQEKGAQPWEAGLRAAFQDAVHKGDVLFGVCHARMVESADESGEARATVCLEQAGEPYKKMATATIRAGEKWEAFYVSGAADADYDAGKAQITFHLAHHAQVIELAGIAVVNLGPNADVKRLPHNRIHYDGGGDDAPWRKEARARIEAIRKGDLKITVKDKDGKPVEGARVTAKMTKHAFGFGTAVNPDLILNQESKDAAQYREWIKKVFNKAVMENAMKWAPWEDPKSRARLLPAVEWLKANGIALRGHNLVWPGWKHQLPRDLRSLKPEQLRERINDHIREEAGYFKGQLTEWDVINEPRANKDFMNLLGDEAMVEWFKVAREADPVAKLYVNDYGILTNTSKQNQDQSYAITKYLVDHGAPIDGAGFQGHFGSNLPKPEAMLAILDRFGAFGLDMMVTEFDVDIRDEDAQARFTRDLFTVAFSHPRIAGIVMWGFWEGRHWKPNGAMIRRDWSLKPNGQAYVDLVLKEWWTNETGATNASGQYALRGFLGDYEITIAKDGKTTTQPLQLSKDSGAVEIIR